MDSSKDDDSTDSSDIDNSELLNASIFSSYSKYDDGISDNNDANRPNKGFRALNWNINGAITRKNELAYFINTKNYDIITLQETRLTSKTHWNLDFPGYKKYVLPAENREGQLSTRGLITFVKEELASEKVTHPDYRDIFENLIVNIRTPGGTHEIQNIYWSPSRCAKNFPNLTKANKSANSISICGDLNAKHQQWLAPNEPNTHGKVLARMLNNSPLVLMNNPKIPTTKYGSILDMCIVSSNISAVTNVEVLDTMSDAHYPLEIEINIKRFIDKESFIPRFKFESADWKTFMNKLEENFLNSDLIDQISPEKLDEAAMKMAEIYYETAFQTIPQTKYHHRPWQSWYWTPEVARATRKANYWRRAHKKKLIIPNLKIHKEKAIREESEIITNAKHNAWTKICNDIILTNNDRKAWQRIKSLRRTGLPSIKLKQINPQDKAEELAKAFAQRTSSTNLTRRIQNTMALLEPGRLAMINAAINTPDPEYDIDITDFEINKAYTKGKDSAPGSDKITYKMVKNSGPVAKSIARKIYNISWNTSRLAESWKTAAQVPIPKPQNRNEFRPISLLSVFDKNIERIAHSRMMSKTVDKMHPNLYGFVKDRGTQDGLMTLSHKASSHIFSKNSANLNNRGTKCVAIFVDLEKAFEMANKNVILSTLVTLGVKGKLLAWIQNYLSDRKGYVTIDGSKSDTHDFENGTPQGSIISPALFNVLIHALLSYKWPKNVEVYSYADDLVILVRARNYQKVTQQALDVLSKACEELGLKINSKKTKIMYFFRVNKTEKQTHRYYVGINEDAAIIEIVEEFKYLGVLYTSTLNMAKHIDYTVSKAYRKINLLKALACKEYGCDTNTLVKYVTACIRPVLEYGILTLNSASISKKASQKIESVLPKALKIALGVPASTRNHAVLLEAGVLPVEARTKQASMTALAKIVRGHSKHPLTDEIDKSVERINMYWYVHEKFKIDKINEGKRNPIPENRQAWLQNTIIQLMNQNRVVKSLLNSVNTQVNYKVPVGAPYRHNTDLRIAPLAESKKILTEEKKIAARNTYISMINELSNNVYLTIYTDASVDPNTNKATYACAVFKEGLYESELSVSGRISNFAGSMTAELHAIKRAILLIYQHRANFNGRKFLIVTDSMSGLQALPNTADPDNRACILKIHKILDTLDSTFQIQGTIMWCPSHIGIPGNEKADELAGAAMTENLPISPTPAATSVIKSKIKAAVLDAWKSKAIISDFYMRVNPKRSSFRMPKAPRKIQCSISRLRFNAEKFCAYRCQKLCFYCEAPFSTGHYFIDCPVTRKPLESLLSLLKEEEHDLNEDRQAAIILSRIAQGQHELLIEVIRKHAPYSYCEAHNNPPKFQHITFMPP